MIAWWGLRESPLHQVLGMILCLCGTLLACRCRRIKRKCKQQGPRFALQLKSIIMLLACLRNTCKSSIFWPGDIADNPASLVVEAIKTIIWKPPIVPVETKFTLVYGPLFPILQGLLQSWIVTIHEDNVPNNTFINASKPINLVVTSSECPSCKHSLKRSKRQLKTKSHDL